MLRSNPKTLHAIQNKAFDLHLHFQGRLEENRPLTPDEQLQVARVEDLLDHAMEIVAPPPDPALMQEAAEQLIELIGGEDECHSAEMKTLYRKVERALKAARRTP